MDLPLSILILFPFRGILGGLSPFLVTTTMDDAFFSPFAKVPFWAVTITWDVFSEVAALLFVTLPLQLLAAVLSREFCDECFNMPWASFSIILPSS